MKILLVQPPYPNAIARDTLPVSQPIGLAYLGAVAGRDGHTVRVLDLAVPDRAPSVVVTALEEFDPEVVGISCPFSLVFPTALDVARLTKERNSQTVVVMGGAHPSTCPDEALSHPSIDCVVIGEGEPTLAGLLAGQPHTVLDGFAYRAGGKVVINPKTQFVRDLDVLPFPARSLLNLDAYWSPDLPKVRGIAGRRWTPLVTSRGCPYQCNFCSVSTVWHRRWRARSPENVMAEILEAVHHFGVDAFNIEDDNFTLDMDRAKTILRLVRDASLNLEWRTPNGLRADRLDREMLELMREAGFKAVSLGIESGDQTVNRKVIGKGLDLKAVESAVWHGSRAGLHMRGFFMLGMPGERKIDMLKTVAFAARLTRFGLHDAAFFITTPYVGTPLHKIVVDKGYLTIPQSELHLARADRGVIKTEQFTPRQVESIQVLAYTITNIVAGRPRAAFGFVKRYFRRMISNRRGRPDVKAEPPGRDATAHR
jgi:anaerobic magnesium-protoporphyrin IX monomethyl ester cyclase